MKVTWATALLLLCCTAVTSLPTTNFQTDVGELFGVPGDYEPDRLEKRRGGGGGRGGSSSSSSSSSGSSRSGSSSGSSSGSGSGKTSSSSNIGGTTSKGSGVSTSYGGGRYDTSYGTTYGSTYGPTRSKYGSSSSLRKYIGKAYGKNRYYAGGASTPYRSGAISPLGITPFLLPVAALAFFPGLWYHPVYVYDYNNNYNYHNDNTNSNSSLPVACLCEEYQECGCDDNTNSTYFESLFNSTQPRNTSVVSVATVNGTKKIYVNGTLANGTTAADSSAASGAMASMLQSSGYWVTIALVFALVWGF
ncbi:uncharacterized protein N7483_005531 [Penicillium malachiteum]|uniref:uncharacterized protein n=1 Tax=Penicillium malachiteum TaxID=1324776 RepID=UPI0025468852|nr:uncharacterized protein N7483_005531 [Penicillium malachiteum]KAJ5731023.1 hypothetical protein N7483_005531 [Penicillium malachiteum]